MIQTCRGCDSVFPATRANQLYCRPPSGSSSNVSPCSSRMRMKGYRDAKKSQREAPQSASRSLVIGGNMRGHIKQRSKGSWTIVLDLGRDPSTGKRRQQWVTHRGTRKEAEKKLAELQNQLKDRVEAGESWVDTDFVFTNGIGNCIDPDNLRRRSFGPLLKNAGLPPNSVPRPATHSCHTSLGSGHEAESCTRATRTQPNWRNYG